MPAYVLACCDWSANRAQGTRRGRITSTAQPLRNMAVPVPLHPMSVRKAVMSPPGDRTALK